MNVILNIQLLDGPMRGRYVEVDEAIARRGTVRLAEPPTFVAADPKIKFEVRIHRYLTKWTSRHGWIALYDGPE